MHRLLFPAIKPSFSLAMLMGLLVLVSSCEDPEINPDHAEAGRGVFICNEGNFTFGNASLSFYNADSLKIFNQVFYNTNFFPPGDVLQSMTIIDTLGFLVINNSGKILVISTNSFKHVATISGLNSPRYVLPVNHQKAYVSDLYSKSITIINPVTFKITGSVRVGASTEQMVIFEDFVFATGWSMNNKIYKINSGTDKVEDSLTVAMQPNSLVIDKNNMLWILSDGSYEGSPVGREVPALTIIDPVSFNIVEELKFPDPFASPSRLTITGNGDTLYFINGSWSGTGNEGGVYKMPVNTMELPDDPFIAEEDHLFYGLGIDPRSSEIYVSDALDFLQKGWIFRYNSAGMIIDSFKVDITPGSFCFASPPL